MVKAKTELLTNNLLKYTAARAHKKAKAFWFSKEGIAKNKALAEKLAKRKARKVRKADEKKKKADAAAKPVDGKKAPAAHKVKLTKPVHKSKVPIRWYPAEGVRVHSSRINPTKLRKSLVPGTVVIILSGRFKGKRAIFLKQLPSGLLLITGPYSVNGIPLRRMNQAYVIATKTHIDISSLKVDPKFDDKYFKRPCKRQHPKGETEFFHQRRRKAHLSKAEKEDQKAFDKQVAPLLKQKPLLAEYLGAHFELTHGQFPHLMQF